MKDTEEPSETPGKGNWGLKGLCAEKEPREKTGSGDRDAKDSRDPPTRTAEKGQPHSARGDGRYPQ